MKHLRIGTRGSELALWQARHVRETLLAAHPQLQVDMEIISTKGDRVLDISLAKIPGKGLFTKEIEDSLLAGSVDLAVHSLKDLPTEIAPRLALSAIMTREDPADALISRDGLTLDDLPQGATIMTGSLRREAQLRHRRPDLKIMPVRGNVPTRIRKFREAGVDGIILALAGLRRLVLDQNVTQRLAPEEFLPACGQGALALEIREGDDATQELCTPLVHLPTWMCVSAERAYLGGMGGGCQAPIGAFAHFAPGSSEMTIAGIAADVDGSNLVRQTLTAPCGSVAAALKIGRQLSQAVRCAGGEEILQRIEQQPKPTQETA